MFLILAPFITPKRYPLKIETRFLHLNQPQASKSNIESTYDLQTQPRKIYRSFHYILHRWNDYFSWHSKWKLSLIEVHENLHNNTFLASF